MANDINVLVIGTGAIGSFYGGKLAQVGAKVSTLCRSDYDVVKEKGIQVKSIMGDFHFKPHQVIKDISEYTEEADYILVGTKVLPELNISEMIRSAVKKNSSIFLLQNGIDIEKQVAQDFPDNEIISGLAFICVSRLSPGIVDHQDYGRVIIGRYPGGSSEKIDRLGELYNQSGIKCKVTENVITARWQKLVWNAPFNPMSVLGGGINTKEILDSAENAELAEAVMNEVCAVAEADGHPLGEKIVKQNLENTYVMTPYKTSMLLDFEGRRPLELEAILGNAIRLAEQYQVPVPRMKTLYALLKVNDEKNRRIL